MSNEKGLVTLVRNAFLILIGSGAILSVRYSHITRGFVQRTWVFLGTPDGAINRLSTALVKAEGGCTVQWKNEHINNTLYELRQFEPMSTTDNEKKDFKPILLYPNPTFKMAPDKFILPILQNGPNNQLVGFRETVFIGMKLNRTIVIPKFNKHHSDSQKDIPHVSPVHRIQVSTLCNFISCVSYDTFRKACNYTVDAVLNTRKFSDRQVIGWEKYMGMEIRRSFNNETQTADKIKLLPETPFPGHRSGVRIFRAQDVIPLFDSTAKCVMLPRPLYDLHLRRVRKKDFGKKLELVTDAESLQRLSDTRLSLTISHHSKNPRYITKLAEDFWQSQMGGRPYLSLHWRYQRNEFMQRCKGAPSSNRVKEKICNNALLITVEDISVSIESKIHAVRNMAKLYNIRDVYVASPPSERKLIADLGRILYEKHGWVTYSSLNLTGFLDVKFSSCPELQKHYNDILSTTEMEICALGVAFLGSQRSSWSDVVQLSRRTSPYDHVLKQFDGDIFRMSFELIKKRNESKKAERFETDSNHFVVEAKT